MDIMELKKAIEAKWQKRVEAQGFKVGSAAYRKAEYEFFAGAMCAIQELQPNPDATKLSAMIPPIWVVNAMSGRPICEVTK